MSRKPKAIKKHPWLYKLDEDYIWDSGGNVSSGVFFESKWLRVDCGFITVRKNYAWDGCSYKWSVLDLFVVGVPDGRLRYGLPITYHASLIHDALTQFRHELPITHQQATAIFSALLKESGFFWRHVYVYMVKKFGEKDFKGNSDDV